MERVTKTILCLAATAALAGCYNPRYPSEGPGHERTEQAPVRSGSGGPVMSSGDSRTVTPYRVGRGTIEGIQRTPTSAAAGGTMSPQPVGYQLTIRMDDGAVVQSLIQDSPNYRVGDRVEVTSSGRVNRL